MKKSSKFVLNLVTLLVAILIAYIISLFFDIKDFALYGLIIWLIVIKEDRS